MAPLTAARMEEVTDTEITLGTSKMLALFFGLVVLCAVFFGMGFSMGRSSARVAPELLPSPSQTARNPSGNKPIILPSQPASAASSTTSAQPSADNASNAPSAPTNSAPDQSPPAQAPGAASVAGYYVQVAAVSKQEDAEALVESLKGRQYQAFIANQPADKLFHVQVGPFADVKEAESMRSKLVSDGYNPILKK